MKYMIAKFHIDTDNELMQTARDLLAASLGEIAFEAFEDTAKGINGFIPTDSFHDETIRQALDDFELEAVSITYTIEQMEDKNWNKTWEDSGFSNIIVDDKIIIYDAKHVSPSIDTLGKLWIGIDAVQAFGTGTHQTTQMIVSTLLQHDLQGKRVLDCGCGTGILGITAAKLGAGDVVGYDIDEWSVENAQHNAALNEVENMSILLGDAGVLSHVCGVFDIILANINRNILLNDISTFKDAMSGEAKLVLSGFYIGDAKLLTEKAREYNLEEESKYEKDGWCCLVFKQEA